MVALWHPWVSQNVNAGSQTLNLTLERVWLGECPLDEGIREALCLTTGALALETASLMLKGNQCRCLGSFGLNLWLRVG